MNPLPKQNRFEPSPYTIIGEIGGYLNMQQKVAEMMKRPPNMRRQIPQIPVKTAFPSITMVIGKIGSGKSTRLKRFAEQFFEEGMCVLDLNDWGGLESACYMLPNKSMEVWANFNSVLSASGKAPMNFQGRTYPTILYVPATRGLSEKLPDFFRPFRIAWQTLEFTEMITLCGFQRGDVAVELLDLAWTTRPKKETFEEFVKRAIEMCAYGRLNVTLHGSKTVGVPTAEKRSFPPLLRRLKTLYDLGIICDENDPLALDLHDMMMDTKHIHAFSVGYISDRIDVPFLIYGYLIRRIYNLRKNPNTDYPKMAMMIREAQKLAPQTSEFDGQEISRSCLRAVGRECRHLKLWVYLDSQDQIQIDTDLKRKAFVWYIYLSDKVVVDLLRKLFYIPDTVAYAIPKLPIGFCAVYYKTYVGVPVIYYPPLSHVKAYDEKFLKLWEKEHHGERWKKWNIPMPDSEDIISFEIPDETEIVKESGGRGAKLLTKYYTFLVGLLKEYGEVNIRKYVEMIGIDLSYFDRFVRHTTEFRENIITKEGVARLRKPIPRQSSQTSDKQD